MIEIWIVGCISDSRLYLRIIVGILIGIPLLRQMVVVPSQRRGKELGNEIFDCGVDVFIFVRV